MTAMGFTTALLRILPVTVGVLLPAADVPRISNSDIIQNAVATNTKDWLFEGGLSHSERILKTKVDPAGHSEERGSRTIEFVLLDGSPYERLIGLNNEPLSRDQQMEEQAKLDRECARRRVESASERQARIAKFNEQRGEEHLLMQQMVAAFQFKLLGEEQVGGVDCYHFEADPRPDYHPPVEKARVLLGMRGEMWIDKREFHWVKVRAEVTQPVSFGFFIAKVKPGTRFELEQAPFGKFWLPKHFIQTVNASVLGIYGYRSQEETFYSDYREANPADAFRAALH